MKTLNRAAVRVAMAGLFAALLPAVAAATAPTPDGDAWDGESVDLSTGLFVLHTPDLVANDGLPVTFTRTFQAANANAGVFGQGGAHSYHIRFSAAPPYQEGELRLPDGNAVHYVRVSPGTDLLSTVFEAAAGPRAFLGSTATWSGGWLVTTADGTAYHFDEFGRFDRLTDAWGRVSEPIYSFNPIGQGSPVLTRITTSSVRWIGLAYDASNRIVEARDTGGSRVVSYGYDAAGRLATVTDPEGGLTRFTYDSGGRMVTVQDPSGVVRLTNQYDAGGRVVRQTLANQSAWTFAYTVGASNRVIRTDVTDPRGAVRRVTFDANGYRTSDSRALGTVSEQTVTYDRDLAGRVLATVDALGRRTTFTYDAGGNVTSLTRAAGSSEAATTTFEYAPAGSTGLLRVARVVDPLGQSTTVTYNADGFPVEIRDPLGHRTHLAGRRPLVAGLDEILSQVGDPLGNSTAFFYGTGLVASIIDPLGRKTSRGYDVAARLNSVTDPLGRRTTLAYDRADRVTQITDPAGGVTRLAYDVNGNLRSVTDARDKVTRYTYDEMNRVVTRTDPLGHAEVSAYDAKGNLAAATDRKGQTTAFAYDALDRLVTATYADGSTTAYVWDGGNRLVQITDSVSGSITRTWDLHDRLVSESTPQGTIRFTYDAAGRRTSMTVDGQPAVSYGYDAASRLTRLARAGESVDVSYDAAGRRTAITFPNGIGVEHAHDAASQLVGLTYRRGGSVLGTLTYGYDWAGRRTRVGGTWARLALPQPVPLSVHDEADRLLIWGDLTLAHDENGNLVSDGANTYGWNARDQLVAIDGPGVIADFGYDGLGRRSHMNIDGTATAFVHDGPEPVREVGSAGVVDLLGGLDHPRVRWDADGSLALLTDALGSVVALAEETGAVLAEYTYEPFGTAAGAVALDARQFAGRENDGTGLHFYQTGYYRPMLHRFLDEGRMGRAGGSANAYRFARNDPATVTYRSAAEASPSLIVGVHEPTKAGAVTVDPWPAAKALRIAASPELERVLRDPVVAASLRRIGGFPVPARWTTDHLVASPPRGGDLRSRISPQPRQTIDHHPAGALYRIDAR